ncbi:MULTISPECIES: FadR/GntR family transcriptional regulator [unclassified Pseudactinotalea]|uniref:FadR/GntR family transcriptional regulator n=1 Tax=unclassified Pseudactinotalea TaxID=2649176 RepID=UPI00128CEE47|nr:MULTISPECIES: FadR/GntR family transcriptional regulator [unclassified Pseudactinotalea]MPV48933.1 GntR family transcriptional regulator [Pseudactinotalea sp. HY160]QGH70881.1 GntR family transcriptional regulator [Pseudactinotalea sp. HY158]
MKPARSRNEDVVEAIKQYIIDERLQPGDPLPTENQLIEAIGASRTSVREAMKRLSALDIVDIRHGYGTYVGRISMRALVEALAFRGQLSRGTDGRMLEDLVDIRMLLEQGLSRPMIDSLGTIDLAYLRELAVRMRRLAMEGKPYVEEDRAFHMRLMKAIGNELMVQLTEAFWLVQARIAPSLPVTPQDWTATAEAHGRIVDALEAKDAVALRAALAVHYEPVRNVLHQLARDGQFTPVEADEATPDRARA